jgi:hypothetical protein
METKSNHKNDTTKFEKANEQHGLSHKTRTLPNTQQIRGPGWVVCVSSPRMGGRLFITWAETGVAELSPDRKDAWRYPTPTAANDGVRRAFGPRIRSYAVAVLPEGDGDSPKPHASRAAGARLRSGDGESAGSVKTSAGQYGHALDSAPESDGGVIPYNTCEFAIQR